MLKRSLSINSDGTSSSDIPYPVEVFSPKIRRFIQETADSFGVDTSGPASILLSAVSAAIGGAARIEVKEGYHENAPIWTALVAPPGSAKSPIFMQVLEPLEILQAEADRRYEKEMKAYNRNIEQYKSEHQHWKKITKTNPSAVMPKRPVKPVRERILLDDVSAASVMETLHQCPFGSMMNRDELSSLFDSLDRRGGISRESLLSFHSGKSTRCSRSGKEDLVIPRPAFVVSGTIQPKRLRTLFRKDSSLEDSGLSARFLYCTSPDNGVRWNRATIARQAKEDYSALIRTIFNIRHPEIMLDKPMELFVNHIGYRQSNRFQAAPEAAPASEAYRNKVWTVPAEFAGSPEANDIYDAFQRANEAKRDRETNDMVLYGLSKMPIHVARIALNLHILLCAELGLHYSDWPYEVSAKTMSSAVKLAEWYENELRKVAALVHGNDVNKESDMDRILCVIEQAGGELSIRDLQRKLGRRFSEQGGAGKLEGILEEMSRLGILSVRSEKAGNGRFVRYYVLPDFVDADTMTENTGVNEDSVNIVLPEGNPPSVDTTCEPVGKYSVNVNMSTQERSPLMENSSADTGPTMDEISLN